MDKTFVTPQSASYIHTSCSEEERLNVRSLLLQDIDEPKDYRLVEKKNIPILHGKSFNRLRQEIWLNDELVNFYMLLLQDRDTELCRLKGGNDRDRSMFNSTFFFNRLRNPDTQQYDFSGVQRWTKYNVFRLKCLYFPLNFPVNQHWSLFIVDIHSRLIRYYDPFFGEDKLHANVLQNWLRDEARDKQVLEFIDVEWKVEYVKCMPRQKGSTACGVLLILCADCLSLDKNFDYDMRSVPQARVDIGCAILRGYLGKIEGQQVPLDIASGWVEDIMSGPRPPRLQSSLSKVKQSEVIDVS